MAMSLEDLLSEEGFKRRKDKMKARASFASERRSVPLYMDHDARESVRRTERTRSDIPRYDSKAEFSTSGSFSVRKPRQNLSRREKEQQSDEGIAEFNGGGRRRRSRRDSFDAKRFSVTSEITEVDQSDGIVVEGTNIPYKDIHSNKAYEGKNNSFKNAYLHIDPRSFKQPQSSEGSEGRSNAVAESGKTFDESRSIRQNKLDEVQAVPSLDEAAIKAIISIFSGHAKQFLNDEDFRISLHHNSFASLNLLGADESLSTESKVVENLEQAIETVERAAEESATLKELKRASLQLSVITGLNSTDLKNGFTSGVPNLRLSACAHLYLSIIYVLQMKDKVAAKHLLQVFCDSPLQARMTLLPDLWDQVFLPHLLHLKVWYTKETQNAADSPVFMNLKLLERAYNKSLDLGTYQFAMYYKAWMTDGDEAPSVPIIRIPSFSGQLMLRGHTSSPASHVSPRTMVSKHLYNEVFKHSDRLGVESQLNEEEEEFEGSVARSFDSPAPEDKQLILCVQDSVVPANKEVERVQESPSNNVPDEPWIMQLENSSGEENRHERHQTHSEKENNLAIQRPQIAKHEPEPPLQEFQNFESSIPEDFVCPLTGLIFKEPVTLETGQTYEHEAIDDWFNKGSFSCPVTGKLLCYEAVPPTNLILKRLIDKWKTDHIDNLLALLSQVTSGSGGNSGLNDKMIICILGQLLPVFNKDERIIHARRVLSFGGLRFLLTRFHSSEPEEKAFISALLCCCIDADAGCRNWIARNINQSDLLELLQSEELISRKNAVLLLTELICFNRRSRAKCFLEGLGDEEILNALDHLIVYLQTCPLEQTPLVAVLILHLDLLSDRQESNTHRQEAVNALTTALMKSLTDDEKLQNKCCEALLILGGFFSLSGKLMTEDWILKLAGFLNGPDWDVGDNDNDSTVDGTITTVDHAGEDDEEENAREKWLTGLTASLLGDGKKSFLDAVSKSLSLGKSDLVRVCLTTVAWLSFSLASLRDTRYQLAAFSALISPLKQYLEYGVLVEQRILASLSLLNFSTIPECRILLMKIGDEIASSLDDLAEVTWTASELNAIIYGQRRVVLSGRRRDIMADRHHHQSAVKLLMQKATHTSGRVLYIAIEK